ncbi:hypothetical protein J1N35_000943 [Gossypium stocksii]|uniref:Uncharacterized protein n=1 Tax=Gossypium stocksii TaxID=47602 RepID=A0A9D3WI54_9ROSI|nr:hypothetical protein J1N35_000943 [Gossypium stocksii]
MLGNLQAINDDEADYLYNIPFKQWKQSYDGVYGMGTGRQNLAKCINSVLKGTRHLPVTSIVKETYFHFTELFPKRAVNYVRQCREAMFGAMMYWKKLKRQQHEQTLCI